MIASQGLSSVNYYIKHIFVSLLSFTEDPPLPRKCKGEKEGRKPLLARYNTHQNRDVNKVL